jgi:hypothetical protein
MIEQRREPGSVEAPPIGDVLEHLEGARRRESLPLGGEVLAPGRDQRHCTHVKATIISWMRFELSWIQAHVPPASPQRRCTDP